MALLSELVLWRWVRIGASLAGLTSGLIALIRLMTGGSFQHVITQGAGWLGVAYVCGSGVFCLYLAYNSRQQLWLAAILLLLTVAIGFATFGWVVSVHTSETQLAGAIFGGLGLLSLALYYAPDVIHALSTNQKGCPDCCETVKSEARVCKFCGYRFSPSLVDGAALVE